MKIIFDIKDMIDDNNFNCENIYEAYQIKENEFKLREKIKQIYIELYNKIHQKNFDAKRLESQ